VTLLGDSRQILGLLVTRQPEERARSLETLLMNEGLGKDMDEAGRRRVQAFDLEPVARRFMEACAA
jgi:hypothetical protein